MKKMLWIAILMAATGGALYYLFGMNEKDKAPGNSVQQTITGEWKIDSVAMSKKDSTKTIALLVLALDTNFTKYSYAVHEDGRIIKKLGDSTLAEKIRYQIKDSTGIVIHEDGDSTSFELKFTEKQKDGFVLMDKDSTVYFFKRKQ